MAEIYVFDLFYEGWSRDGVLVRRDVHFLIPAPFKFRFRYEQSKKMNTSLYSRWLTLGSSRVYIGLGSINAAQQIQVQVSVLKKSLNRSIGWVIWCSITL